LVWAAAEPGGREVRGFFLSFAVRRHVSGDGGGGGGGGGGGEGAVHVLHQPLDLLAAPLKGGARAWPPRKAAAGDTVGSIRLARGRYTALAEVWNLFLPTLQQFLEDLSHHRAFLMAEPSGGVEALDWDRHRQPVAWVRHGSGHDAGAGKQVRKSS
jgi:hypothetical protein